MVDPVILIGCLHSFCKICIDKVLKGKGEVMCPYCRSRTKRADVKDDFNTRELVEVYGKSVTSSTAIDSDSDGTYTRRV